MSTEIIEINDDKVNKLASLIHEVWKIGIQQEYMNVGLSPRTERMRASKMGDGLQVNINVPYNELNKPWQDEQKKAAELALNTVCKYPDNPELAFDYIHNEWLNRNSWARGDKNYDTPFKQLSINEKEKDILHYLLAKKIIEGGHINISDILYEAQRMSYIF